MTDARVPAAEEPRGVIVGAGLMGRWHAHAVRRAGFQVAAVVDADMSRARALAAHHPGARFARSVTELGMQGLVAHVCTPESTHVMVVRESLASGCHVIVEKPVAPSVAATRELVARAAAAGRLLVPVHQYPFQAGVARAARVLPTLGPVLHVEAVACTAGADGRTDAQRDQLTVDVLPHPLSLLARLVDPAVDEVAWNVLRPSPGELRVTGELSGASVSIVVSTHGRPTRNTLRLICARGTVSLDLFHGFATCLTGSPSRGFKIAHPFLESAHTAVRAAMNLATRVARRDMAYPGLRELVHASYVAASRGASARAHAPIADAETIAIARAVEIIGGGRTPYGDPGAPAFAGRLSGTPHVAVTLGAERERGPTS
jgi:predicted dehydrogenase